MPNMYDMFICDNSVLQHEQRSVELIGCSGFSGSLMPVLCCCYRAEKYKREYEEKYIIYHRLHEDIEDTKCVNGPIHTFFSCLVQ